MKNHSRFLPLLFLLPSLPYSYCCENYMSVYFDTTSTEEILSQKQKWQESVKGILTDGIEPESIRDWTMGEIIGPVLAPKGNVLQEVDNVWIFPLPDKADCVILIMGYHDNWKLYRQIQNKAQQCMILITYCRRLPYPLPQDIVDRAKLVSTCNNDHERRVSWESVVRDTAIAQPPALVIIDPTVFDNWILEEMLQMPSFLPDQLNVVIKRAGGSLPTLVTLLNKIYSSAFYVPVHEQPIAANDASHILFVRLACPDTQLNQSNVTINAFSITKTTAQKQHHIELVHMFPAKRLMARYNPDSPRFRNVIHQTAKSPHHLKVLPAPSIYAINSWSIMNPGWKHVMWYDDDLAIFMMRYFSTFAATFVDLNGVQKSDMFRYLVVYQFGGVYADLDVICLRGVGSLMMFSSSNTQMPVAKERSAVQDAVQWKDRVTDAHANFPLHPMISKVHEATLSTSSPAAEPTILWYSNGNVTAAATIESTNILYIGEERTTVDRPDGNLLYPIQYLQWWFMASRPKHSALLTVAKDINFKAQSMHMDVDRPSREWNFQHRNQFTLWFTGPFGFTASIQKWLQHNAISDQFVTLFNECVAGFSIWHNLECSVEARPAVLHLFQGAWKNT